MPEAMVALDARASLGFLCRLLWANNFSAFGVLHDLGNTDCHGARQDKCN